MTGRPRRHPEPRRDDTGRRLATRAVVALLTGRHVDTVRKAVPPVACDVASRAMLVDIAEAAAVLDRHPNERHGSRPGVSQSGQAFHTP